MAAAMYNYKTTYYALIMVSLPRIEQNFYFVQLAVYIYLLVVYNASIGINCLGAKKGELWITGARPPLF